MNNKGTWTLNLVQTLTQNITYTSTILPLFRCFQISSGSVPLLAFPSSWPPFLCLCTSELLPWRFKHVYQVPADLSCAIFTLQTIISYESRFVQFFVCNMIFFHAGQIVFYHTGVAAVSGRINKRLAGDAAEADARTLWLLVPCSIWQVDLCLRFVKLVDIKEKNYKMLRVNLEDW